MSKSRLTVAGVALATMAALSACNKPEETGAANPPPPAPATEPSDQPAPKVDPTPAISLEAGIKAMQPRLVSTVDAYNKIEVQPSFRYFMHPLMDKRAEAEFDVAGLTSLNLSPYIGDLRESPDCYRDPEAGKVALTWSFEDGRTGTVDVDRNYTASVPLEVKGAKKLRLEVDQANNAITCDWFSVGFLDVK